MARRVVTREELETLPPGLYLLDEPLQPEASVYDIETDAMLRCLDLKLYARVRENAVIPRGVEDVMVRRDGKVVITSWGTEKE